MANDSVIIVQTIREDSHLAPFARRLLAWLVSEAGRGPNEWTESRARALLRAASVVDDPTLHDFGRLVETPAGIRLAFYDLLQLTKLADVPEVATFAGLAGQTTDPTSPNKIEWLALSLAAFAWSRQFPLERLDPANPPDPHSPAGQIVTRTAHFIRQQVQRTATERDKMLRKLATPLTPSLEQMAPPPESVAPLPPYYRPPIPVRYPEVVNETVRIEATEPPAPPPIASHLVITEADLPGNPPAASPPVTMPTITIRPEQVTASNPPSPLPRSGVIMPGPTAEARPGMSLGLRQMFRGEEMKNTKLRVIVQQYPDGPGLYGLQVRVSCKGIKSYVAGVTDRDGHFVAELPVRLREGLTYDVDVTWPRDVGGQTERKSITLNADRTEFPLPFYHQLSPA